MESQFRWNWNPMKTKANKLVLGLNESTFWVIFWAPKKLNYFVRFSLHFSPPPLCVSDRHRRHGVDQTSACPVRQQPCPNLPDPGRGREGGHAWHEPLGRRQADPKLPRREGPQGPRAVRR